VKDGGQGARWGLWWRINHRPHLCYFIDFTKRS